MSHADIAQWTGGSWSFATVPHIHGENEVRRSRLLSVSCVRAKSCFAVGSYLENRTMKALAMRFDGTRWRVVPTPPPAKPLTYVSLSTVSCAGDAVCHGVGRYGDAKAFGGEYGVDEVRAMRWNGTRWLDVDSPTSTKAFLDLFGIACPRPTCACASSADIGTGKYHTLVEALERLHVDGRLDRTHLGSRAQPRSSAYPGIRAFAVRRPQPAGRRPHAERHLDRRLRAHHTRLGVTRTGSDRETPGPAFRRGDTLAWNFADLWESLSDALPERVVLVQGDRRVTWREFDDRAARLAAAFTEPGCSPTRRSRSYLYNCTEYIEGVFATFKMRGVPVNVNYRYLEDELALPARQLRRRGRCCSTASSATASPRCATRRRSVKLWIQVDDGAPRPTFAVEYEELLAAHDPMPRIERSGDDLYFLYTGGTTGMPKGVMWRNERPRAACSPRRRTRSSGRAPPQTAAERRARSPRGSSTPAATACTCPRRR